MALSQADRIAISKKIVTIPLENALIDQTKGQLEMGRAENQLKDDLNKNIFEKPNTLVNAYQLELNQIDGNIRTEISEQDFLDSASKKLRNPFFPNDPLTPTPSLPDGVWKNLIPFSWGHAKGRNYTETYTTMDGEDQLLSSLSSLIVQLETYNAAQRSTLLVCSSGGVCSLPQYTTQTQCTSNGGTWSIATSLDPDPTLTQISNDIVTKVNLWKTRLTTMKSSVPSALVDPDPTRQAQNQAAIVDIDNATPIIDTWLAYPNSVSSSTSDCSSFNASTPDSFGPSKFRSYELQVLKDEIAARGLFKDTRKSQLNTNLGHINQDLTTGSVIDSSGFYGSRFRLINLRLHLMSGTLNALISSERGLNIQDQAKSFNQDAENAYSDQVLVSIFTAPASGTNTIHVKSASGFSVADNIYVVSNTQDELSGTITAISGTKITLSINIPSKYRQDDFARLYKVL